jgi:hypothetical protein
MKKLILCSMLTTLAATNLYAEDSQTISKPVIIPAPITAPATAQPVDVKPAEVGPMIDCNYKIPAKTTLIEQPILLTWAKNATLQSFNFEVATLDTQMTNLKNCYTEQGWQGFNDALQKSGNLESIKTQQLSVKSQLDGEPTIVETKNNQWKLSIPVQVVYQNTKDKIAQALNVTLTIGRKPSGDLGIMQMVAMPRNTKPAIAPATMPLQEVKPAVAAPVITPAPVDVKPAS